MCTPILLGVAALAMSAASGASQASQTSKLNRLRQEEARQNRLSTAEQAAFEGQARRLKQGQQLQQMHNAASDVSKQAEEAISVRSLQTAESGIEGKSSVALIDDFRRQQAEQLAGIDYNIQQIRAGGELEGKATGLQSRLQGLNAPHIGGPTPLSILTGAISSGISMGLAAKGAGIGGGSNPSSGGGGTS